MLVDFDMSITEVPESVLNIYGFKRGEQPNNLRDFIQLRLSSGWISWTELYEEIASPEARLREISSENHLSTFQVGPSGEVLYVSHTKIHSNNKISFSFLSTGLKIDRWRNGIEEIALQIFAEVSKEYGELLKSWLPGFWHRMISTDSVFVALQDGDFILSRVSKGDEFFLKGAKSLSDLPLDHKKVINQMVMHDQSRILFELSGGEQVLLDASRAQEFPGREKPFIVTLRRCDHRSVTQDLLALHPCLTEKEAEVLAGLAAGKPIKSIAEYLGKSKVTVGLQARSAMSKLGITNLNALQTYALLNSRLCAASRNRYSGQPVYSFSPSFKDSFQSPAPEQIETRTNAVS